MTCMVAREQMVDPNDTSAPQWAVDSGVFADV